MNDVNLLPDVKVTSIAEKRRKRYLIFAVIIVSVVWAVALIGLYAYGQMSRGTMESLQSKKVLDQSKMADLSPVGADLTLLKKKLSGIKYVTDNRFDFPNSLKYVFGIIPIDVSPSKISIDESGTVTMNLSSLDSKAAASFVSQMGQEPTLKDPKLLSLRLSDDGRYSYVIIAQYGNGKSTKVNK